MMSAPGVALALMTASRSVQREMIAVGGRRDDEGGRLRRDGRQKKDGPGHS
jgi:hypothetical protein